MIKKLFLLSTVSLGLFFLFIINIPVKAQSICDWAKYVTDVTIPDQTQVVPGLPFTKIWRVTNAGACTWTTSYKMVFSSGDNLGDVNEVNLPDNVLPGQTIDIPVKMIAPVNEGSYASYWMIKNVAGKKFGTGSSADKPLWVKIVVNLDAAPLPTSISLATPTAVVPTATPLPATPLPATTLVSAVQAATQQPTAASPTLAPNLTATVTSDPLSQATSYTTTSDDTLASIAQAKGISIEDLRAANYMIGDSFIPGQRINLPTVSPVPTQTWQFSKIGASINAALYPLSMGSQKFIIYYAPSTLVSVDPQAFSTLVVKAVKNEENLFQGHLGKTYKIYVTGSQFTPSENNLQGRTYSPSLQSFILDDGTGNPTDMQYIIAHELTHAYMWNAVGKPSSELLSEGTAVYAGMKAVTDSPYLPLKTYCGLYYQAGALPHITAGMTFTGQNYDLPNYYASGCFVQYLVETYGIDKLKQVYATGDFETVYDHSLVWLDQDWRTTVKAKKVPSNIDPAQYVAAGTKISAQYRSFFPAFTWTANKIAAYRQLDEARTYFLEGQIDLANQSLAGYQKSLTAQ